MHLNKDGEEIFEDSSSSTFSKKNNHRKEAHRWSHVKISFDTESVRIESEPTAPGAAPTSTALGGVVPTPAVAPAIKIIGKEVS